MKQRPATNEDGKEVKWTSAQHWLTDYVERACADGRLDEVADIARTLAMVCDPDDIQDNFQDLMEEEGYFKE
jgi:hypothetical protein